MAATKRTQNYCKDCGDTWYPRGRSVSHKCPACGSTNVALDFRGLVAGFWLACMGGIALFLASQGALPEIPLDNQPAIQYNKTR